MVRSLLDTGTPHPIRVMCLEDVGDAQQEALRSLGTTVETVRVGTLPLPANVVIPHRAWRVSFSRLHLLRFEEFERIIFLDSDMIVAQRIDHLFECPSLSACAHSYPIREGQVSLNGGLLVLDPDPALFEEITRRYVHLPSPLAPHSWSLSDQEMMIALHSSETYARSWRDAHGIPGHRRWHLLDHRYNAITGLGEQQARGWDARKACVLHYTCGPKPWRAGRRDGFAERLWWEVHDRLAAETAFEPYDPTGSAR